MSFAFTHAALLDGTRNMELRPDMTVLVSDDGIIEKVSPSACAQLPLNARAIDLSGKVLMPGLINMHVHFCGNGKPMSSGGASSLIDKVCANPLGRSYLRHRIQQSAQAQLMSGVTTVRGAGDPIWADIQTRNAINAGKYLGPRMLCAGWGVTPPKGHGRGLIAQLANSEDEARDLARDVFAHGGDLVKLFITGGVFDAEKPGEPGLVRMTPSMARAVVQEAHRLNLPTAAHVESADGVLLALEAGIDTIEHGAPLTPQMIRLFRHNGAGRTSSLTTTISPAIPLSHMDREKTHSSEVVKLNADIVADGIIQCAKDALAAGIPVGLGTDSGCPYVTHYDMWREVVYFNKLAGASAQLALHTATLQNARILGIDDQTGSIEEGKSADLIVLQSNPLADLAALRNVEQVVIRGRIVAHPRVRRIKSLDDELDAVLKRIQSR